MRHPAHRRYLRQGLHGRPQLDQEKVRALKHTVDLRSLYHRVEERIPKTPGIFAITPARGRARAL